jgi:hypothetical protein
MFRAWIVRILRTAYEYFDWDYDWLFLSLLHKNPPAFSMLRDPKVQQEYDTFRASGTNFEAIALAQMGQNSFVVLPNNFPYRTSPGIVHYVVWFSPGINGDLYDAFEQVYKPAEWYSLFENLPQFRSQKGLRHLHLFRYS